MPKMDISCPYRDSCGGQCDECAIHNSFEDLRNTIADLRTRISATLPVTFIALPDGSKLSVTLSPESDYPSIDIWYKPVGGEKRVVAFAEYNDDHPLEELHVGCYQNDQDEPSYYEPYKPLEEN